MVVEAQEEFQFLSNIKELQWVEVMAETKVDGDNHNKDGEANKEVILSKADGEVNKEAIHNKADGVDKEAIHNKEDGVDKVVGDGDYKQFLTNENN